MATVTGAVDFILVTTNKGSPVTTEALVKVTPQGGRPESFIVWSETVAVFTPPAQWIARSSALSLLRDARKNKLTVTITTTSPTSSLIESMSV